MPARGRIVRRQEAVDRGSADALVIMSDPTDKQHQQSSASPVRSPVKRSLSGKKRSKRVAVDSADELSNNEADEILVPADEAVMGNGENGDESRSSKRVRFSDGPSPVDGDEEDDTHQLPLADHVIQTPHASGLSSQLRRTSLNLDDAAIVSKGRAHLKSDRRYRHSLPLVLSSSPNTSFQLQQFSPLRSILDDRQRRRLRRSHLSEELNSIEKDRRDNSKRTLELSRLGEAIQLKDQRLKEAHLELELQKQFAIDVTEDAETEKAGAIERARQLETELIRLREELAEVRNGIGEHDLAYPDLSPGGHDDERVTLGHDLTLINPADIDLPDNEALDVLYSTTLDAEFDDSVNSTDLPSPFPGFPYPTTTPDPTLEADREALEKAVADLSRETSDLRSALQIFTIELRSLGFTDQAEAGADEVLKILRHSFHKARVEVEDIMPGRVSLSATNGELLRNITAYLRSAHATLHDKYTELEESRKLAVILRSQVDGLINKLADTDYRKQTLETQWKELDAASERKEKDLVELESEVDHLQSHNQEQEGSIRQKNEHISALEAEMDGHNDSIERLQNAVQSYRDDVASLESLITRMEEDYSRTIETLQQQSDSKVQDLESQLRRERAFHEAAEEDLSEQTSEITNLKVSLEQASEQLQQLHGDFAESQTALEAEGRRTEAIETVLVKKSDAITELEDRVSVAEGSLAEMRQEVESHRTLVLAERRQREEAELALDDNAAEAEILKHSLEEAGILANELRQKLFEIQQRHEEEEAKGQAAQVQLQRACGAERQRANDLEEANLEKEKRVSEALKRSEEEITQAVARITDLNQTIAQRTERVYLPGAEAAKLQHLAASPAELAESVAQLVSDLQRQFDWLEDLRQDEEAIHRERETQLQALLDRKEEEITHLVAEKESLEQRVEAEAAELLAVQAANADDADKLKAMLSERNVAISTLQANVERLQSALSEEGVERARERAEAAEVQQASEAAAAHLRTTLLGRVIGHRELLRSVVQEMESVTQRIYTRAEESIREEDESLLELGIVDTEVDGEDVVDGEAEAEVELGGEAELVGAEAELVGAEAEAESSVVQVGRMGERPPVENGVVRSEKATTVRHSRKVNVVMAKKGVRGRGKKRVYDSGVGVEDE